jgi:hypothetical protein
LPRKLIDMNDMGTLTESCARAMDNLQSVRALTDIFGAFSGIEDQRVPTHVRDNIDATLRSAIVLLVTYWEAYIEDVCEEAGGNLINFISDPALLPKELRKNIAKELLSDKDELAVWRLSGNEWRSTVLNFYQSERVKRNRSFNSPKSPNTIEFFYRTLGLRDISAHWMYANSKMELDDLVELRGRIVHRGECGQSLDKNRVFECTQLVVLLICHTDIAIREYFKSVAGVEYPPYAIDECRYRFFSYFGDDGERMKGEPVAGGDA